mgnify:CR=1 FL=1
MRYAFVTPKCLCLVLELAPERVRPEMLIRQQDAGRMTVLHAAVHGALAQFATDGGASEAREDAAAMRKALRRPPNCTTFPP